MGEVDISQGSQIMELLGRSEISSCLEIFRFSHWEVEFDIQSFLFEGFSFLLRLILPEVLEMFEYKQE